MPHLFDSQEDSRIIHLALGRQGQTWLHFQDMCAVLLQTVPTSGMEITTVVQQVLSGFGGKDLQFEDIAFAAGHLLGRGLDCPAQGWVRKSFPAPEGGVGGPEPHQWIWRVHEEILMQHGTSESHIWWGLQLGLPGAPVQVWQHLPALVAEWPHLDDAERSRRVAEWKGHCPRS